MKTKELDEEVLLRLQSAKEALRAKCRQPNHKEKLNFKTGLSDTSIAILISSHMEMQSDYFGFREMLLNIAMLTSSSTQSEAIKCYQLCENLLRRFKNTFPKIEESENVSEQLGEYMEAKKETLYLMKALSLPEIEQMNDFVRQLLKAKEEANV